MFELKDVCAGYGSKEILHRISLAFQPGQVTVLSGPNGCGKSTLLKTLVGIVSPSSGEIRLEGESAVSMKTAEMAKRVAYLPQNRQVPDITVLRMVLHGRFAHLNYPRRYRQQDLAIARQALEKVGLADLAEEPLNHLSGGQQQKVYIAMALAQDTETILLDEPTTYLDIAHQLRVLEMVRELAQNGKSVVLVLHDLPQALMIADQVVVLSEGRVVQTGSPEEIVASGKLEEIFGVRVHRVQIESDWQYICQRRQEG